jgi:hypothetical protein
LHTNESATKQLILRKCCRTCGQTKPLDEFYRHTASASGRQSSCKDCQKERAAAWQRAHPERHRAYVYTWKASHPDQVSRHRKLTRSRRDQTTADFIRVVVRVASTVRRAIASGRLVRPDQCSACGRSGIVPDAVHEDYEAPLEVTWLCRRCHYRWTRARKQADARGTDQ